jgi:hypothetical protein
LDSELARHPQREGPLKLLFQTVQHPFLFRRVAHHGLEWFEITQEIRSLLLIRIERFGRSTRL